MKKIYKVSLWIILASPLFAIIFGIVVGLYIRWPKQEPKALVHTSDVLSGVPISPAILVDSPGVYFHGNVYETVYSDSIGFVAFSDTSGNVTIVDGKRLFALLAEIHDMDRKYMEDYWKPVVVIIGSDTSYLRRDTLRFESCGADIRMASQADDDITIVGKDTSYIEDGHLVVENMAYLNGLVFLNPDSEADNLSENKSND